MTERVYDIFNPDREGIITKFGYDWTARVAWDDGDITDVNIDHLGSSILGKPEKKIHKVSVSQDLLTDVLEKLRLSTLYMDHGYENQGDDFKEHKWEPYRKEFIEETQQVYLKLLVEMSDSVGMEISDELRQKAKGNTDGH